MSNLPFGSGAADRSSSKAHLPRVSAPSRPGTRPGIRPVAQDGRRRGRPRLSRFPAAFRPPAFASWASCSRPGIRLSSRSAYRAATNNGPDPDGTSVFRTHETQLGLGALYTRGQRCSRDRHTSPVAARRFSASPCHPARSAGRGMSQLRGINEGSWSSRGQPSPHLCHPGKAGGLGFVSELRTRPLPAAHVRAGTGLEH